MERETLENTTFLYQIDFLKERIIYCIGIPLSSVGPG